MTRIARNELNFELKSIPEFIGIFEHFYGDSIYKDTSMYYINLAYEIETEEMFNLPAEQHSEYQ